MRPSFIKRLFRDDILDLFWRRKRILPSDDPSSFGNIALAKGYVYEDVLKGSILIQRERLKIGEILMAVGLLTVQQCEDILLEQSRMRAKTPTDKSIVEMKYQRSILRRTSQNLASLTKSGRHLILKEENDCK